MNNPWMQWLNEHPTQRYNMASKTGWNDFVHSAPRPRPPTLTLAQALELDEDSLEDYNEARMVWNANPPAVKTAQLASAFNIMKQVMASNRRDGDRLRGSIVIDAAPALGKTTIATRFARDFHGSSQSRV